MFPGRWDLYVSFTEDFGATWTTVNATPENAVQVGPICTGGTTCGRSRNLLDFNDMVIDPATGRVVVAFADGCPGAECSNAVRLQKGTISRQLTGPSMLAAFDPNDPVVPEVPLPLAGLALGAGAVALRRRRTAYAV